MAPILTSTTMQPLQLTASDVSVIDASFSRDLRNTFNHNYHYDVGVDQNGRFKVPKRWIRSDPDLNTFIVIPAPDGAVRCMPVPLFAEKDLVLHRLSCGELAKLDDHNRLQISEQMLRYAGITNCAQLSGARNAFEIWNPQRAAVYFEKVEANFLKYLQALGI